LDGCHGSAEREGSTATESGTPAFLLEFEPAVRPYEVYD
jgi:hypothetical protein